MPGKGEAEEPGFAGVERTGREGHVVEGRAALGVAQDLVAQAVSEIARPGDTGSAVAGREPDSVALTDVRDFIEGVGDDIPSRLCEIPTLLSSGKRPVMTLWRRGALTRGSDSPKATRPPNTTLV